MCVKAKARVQHAAAMVVVAVAPLRAQVAAEARHQGVAAAAVAVEALQVVRRATAVLATVARAATPTLAVTATVVAVRRNHAATCLPLNKPFAAQASARRAVMAVAMGAVMVAR